MRIVLQKNPILKYKLILSYCSASARLKSSKMKNAQFNVRKSIQTDRLPILMNKTIPEHPTSEMFKQF